jgi:hypothetical protein
LEQIRKTQHLATEVASALVQSKVRELKDGEGKLDVMSRLGKLIRFERSEFLWSFDFRAWNNSESKSF